MILAFEFASNHVKAAALIFIISEPCPALAQGFSYSLAFWQKIRAKLAAEPVETIPQLPRPGGAFSYVMLAATSLYKFGRMIKRALGTVLLFALIAGGLSAGVIWIAFDVSSFDQFLEVVRSLWSTLLKLLAR